MSNKVWDRISYAQTEPKPGVKDNAYEQLVKINELLKQELVDALLTIGRLERKITEIKAR